MTTLRTGILFLLVSPILLIGLVVILLELASLVYQK
jgi:hypothetical protein